MKVEEKNNETKKLDFPFYNDDPAIKIKDIIILAIAPILMTILTLLQDHFAILPNGFGPYIFCLIPVVCFLIAARGKISLIIKKPKLRDFGRVLLTLILQYVFVIIVGIFLKQVLNYQTAGNSILDIEMGFSFWSAIIFQLFGEEMYKLLIFLVVLILTFKATKNRNLSISVGLIVSLLAFALIHASSYDNNILQIILCQGVATIFCQYNYLKSKNILTSYLQHVLLDAIPFIMAMTGVLSSIQQ